MASIHCDGKLISSIGNGLLAYLGIARGDGQEDVRYLADKIINLRIFEDNERKMNLSLLDVKGEIMVISQFTLMADCRRGRRPSFTDAETPQDAKLLYSYFINIMKENIGIVAMGVFQHTMAVESINDGPITMLLDSRRCF
jgi:D-tyrosyl-tRNA(Tyr) deacylase